MRKRKMILLDKEHPSALKSINNLALVLRDHGKYELIQEQGRELHRSTRCPENQPQAWKRNTRSMNIAFWSERCWCGKKEQAEEMHRRALGLRQMVLGRGQSASSHTGEHEKPGAGGEQ